MNPSILAVRDIDALIDSIRDVRIVYFSTPSCFYIQLPDEDATYVKMEADLFDFYSLGSVLYLCKENFASANSKQIYSSMLEKQSINQLKGNTLITVKIMGKWLRGVTEEDCPQRCRLVDNGSTILLLESNDIYILDEKFCVLPPRAILSGLGFITPLSPTGAQWTHRAAEIFHMVTGNRNLKCVFLQKGLFDNSVYLFLSSIGKEAGGMIHVNTMLVAFDSAIPEHTGVHHPIWPTDRLS